MTQIKEITQNGSSQVVINDPIIGLVQERLKQILICQGDLQEILEYIQLTNGKMVRPILVSLVFQLCEGKDHELLVDVAAAVELIHIASLVHDDIVDKSVIRRSALTVQERYGPATAVLVGDFLFAEAFALFTVNRLTDLLTLMTDVICNMCEGEVQQLLSPGTDEVYYWGYIYRKTVCLIEAACIVGASVAGTQSHAKLDLLRRFGCNLGYAFQLVDDLLDYSRPNSQIGKNPGNDYLQGMWTLPIIRGVHQGVIPKNWQESLSFEQARGMLYSSGILADIGKEAISYIEQAQNILLKFPESPIRNRLYDLAGFIGARNY